MHQKPTGVLILNMDDIVQFCDNSDFTDITALLYGSGDQENEERVEGSCPCRMPNIDQNREEAAQRLHDDYFFSNPTYPDHTFLRRFCVSKTVFLKVCERLASRYNFFKQCKDAAGCAGITTIQKFTAAI